MKLKDRYEIRKTVFVVTATDKMNDTVWIIPIPLLDLLKEPTEERARDWKRRYQKARHEIIRLTNLLKSSKPSHNSSSKKDCLHTTCITEVNGKCQGNYGLWKNCPIKRSPK